MAGEAAVLRVIEVHAGDTTMYVYAEGVHVDSSADDGADIGPKGNGGADPGVAQATPQ